MAKYDVDSKLLISGKIKEIYENEDGKFYQLRVKHRDGAIVISVADKYVYPESGYEIDDYVQIAGKVLEIITNDDGIFYNLKIKHSTGSINLLIEEQYIKGVKPDDEEGENNGSETNTDPDTNTTEDPTNNG